MKKVQRKKIDAEKAVSEKVANQSGSESAGGISEVDEFDDKPTTSNTSREPAALEDTRSENGDAANTSAHTNGADDSRSHNGDSDADDGDDSVNDDGENGEQEQSAKAKNARKPVNKAKKRKSNADSGVEGDVETARPPNKKKSKGSNKNKKKVPVEEEYEVKEIVGHKLQRGVSYYLIRWKGYTAADDTWEPKDTLSCPELIEKFERNNTSAVNGRAKQSKTSPKSPAKGKGKASATASPLSKKKGGSVDPNKEWEVDKIIDYAVEKGNRVFRIRWKGFAAKHDTWEPEKNLNCNDIIKKFMDRMESLKNVSVKELREEPKKVRRLVTETSRTFNSASGRKSKRAVTKQRVYYGDSD